MTGTETNCKQPLGSAAEQIRNEINASGPISFARFMEIALYAPCVGYYERGPAIGRRGDFYTSVSVGPLFGELLAFQFLLWFRAGFRFETASPIPPEASPLPLSPELMEWQIVEAGAGDGRLAADILSALQFHAPDAFKHLQYWIIEPSSNQRRSQQQTLATHSGRVYWADCWKDFPLTRVHGVIFSNELLDAMPVRRFGWDAQAQRWFEWLVDWQENRFVWAKASARCSTAELGLAIPQQLLAVLPDNLSIELSSAAAQWWREAAGALRKGVLMTIDYGFAEDEKLRPERLNGTLRSYARHRVTDDVLADPGMQDITAHVDFSALAQAGQAAGLYTEGLFAQEKFLTLLLEKSLVEPGAMQWDSSRTRQFKTLTSPQHLGRSFRVLIQSRADR